MTKQEAFDEVWNYFVVEGNPQAKGENGFCRYRTKDGCRCAAGVLIRDEEYNPLFENKTIETILRNNCRSEFKTPQSLIDRLGEILHFVGHLQGAHDSFDETSDVTFQVWMFKRLCRIADDESLAIPFAN